MASSPFSGINANRFFGAGWNQNTSYLTNPFQTPTGQDKAYRGTGITQLPETFAGWEGAARYSFLPAMMYAQQSAPLGNFYRQQMNQDYGSTLFNQAKQQIGAQSGALRSQMQQASARSGTGGGGATSPMAQYQLQNEAMARAGQLGTAARASVLQAQQMRTAGAQGYQNYLSSLYQALLAPAQFQTARHASSPVGQAGPSMVGPALNAVGGFLNAMA